MGVKRGLALLLALALVAAFPVAIGAQQVAGGCNQRAVVSQTATAVVIAGVSGASIHICGIVVNASATTATFALVEGTGSTCGTGTAALIGDTTNRLSPPVGVAISAVAAGPWLHTINPGDDVCLNQSGAGTLAGVVSYSQR